MKAVLFTFLFAVLLVIFSNQSYSQYQVGRNTAGAMVGFGGGMYTGTGAIPIAVEFHFQLGNDQFFLDGTIVG